MSVGDQQAGPGPAENEDVERVLAFDGVWCLAYAPEFRQALAVLCKEEHAKLEVISHTLLRVTTGRALRRSDLPFTLDSLHSRAMMRAKKFHMGYTDIHGIPLYWTRSAGRVREVEEGFWHLSLNKVSVLAPPEGSGRRSVEHVFEGTNLSIKA